MRRTLGAAAAGERSARAADLLRVAQGACLVADHFVAQAALRQTSVVGRTLFRTPPSPTRANAPSPGAYPEHPRAAVHSQPTPHSTDPVAVSPASPPSATAFTSSGGTAGQEEKTEVTAMTRNEETVPQPGMEPSRMDSFQAAKVESEKPEQYQESQRSTFDRIKYLQEQQQRIKEDSKQRDVPSSQLSRLWHFGGLGVRMGMSALGEAALRSVGLGSSTSTHPAVSQANTKRLTNTLGRMRGAALKLGQMLSIQDSALLPPELAEIMERVRYAADRMPDRQLEAVMQAELGKEWRSQLKEFDPLPIAAASIGQVHRGVLLDGREVAVKVQYPGVSDSISSDLNNLGGLLKILGVLPKGMYLDNTLRVAQEELLLETDYYREAEATTMMRDYLADEEVFVIPRVIPELSAKRVLTTELIDGQPIEHVVKLDQGTRNMVAEALLRLCLREIFEFRYMQTDPNWSNFLFNPHTRKIGLLDFGACRDFSKSFTEQYMRVIFHAAKQNREGILDASRKLKFLTGEESPVMNEAHCNAVTILGEPFASSEPFDFGSQNVTKRIHNLIPTMLKYRLTPPPTETYSLHRKLSGAFLLCAKLNARFACQPMFIDLYRRYGPALQ